VYRISAETLMRRTMRTRYPWDLFPSKLAHNILLLWFIANYMPFTAGSGKG
jgi:hypothetical protein